MSAKPKYVNSDGVLIRMDDYARFSMSIYRGGGVWEPWYDSSDWLYGTPLDEAAVADLMAEIDTEG